MADRAHLERLHRELLDTGKLIEAGWVSLRMVAVPLDAPKVQLDEMRTAFFAGAQHLFSSIMWSLEGGGDPTENDMRRMDLIDAELKKFITEFELRHGVTKGSA